MSNHQPIQSVAAKKPAPKKPAPKKPSPPPKAAAALEKVAPELGGVQPGELVRISIDVPHAVSIVLGVLPGLMSLRSEIVAKLPEHEIGYLDHLETYALAAWYAHLLWLPQAGPENPVKPLLEEGTALRGALLSDAEALARRGLVDAEMVAEIRAGQGNVDTANDLVALSALFTESWPRIEGRTAATPEEIRRAGNVGPLLLAALGVREHGAQPVAGDAAERRARAFALFVRAYDQTRRAMSYLRWDEGDADILAPSLYKGRGGRPARDDQPEMSGTPEPQIAPATMPA